MLLQAVLILVFSFIDWFLLLLQDVLMQEAKLYLIFEFLTMDLKKYMDTNVPKDGQMDPKLVKSYTYQLLQVP